MGAAVMSRPKSRGQISLRSGDPQDYPKIFANYLGEDEDVKTLAAAVEFLHELAETEAFRKAGIKAITSDTWAPCSSHQFKSQQFYECHVRQWTQTLYHPVGTAAMGTVLHNDLKVKGLKNLRVADGAAMPKIIGGNTNAPIIMIGERAATFIINDWDTSRDDTENYDKQ